MDDPSRLHELICRYLDGGCSADELAELDRLLSTDAAAAEAFAQLVQFDNFIEAELKEQIHRDWLRQFLRSLHMADLLAEEDRAAATAPQAGIPECGTEPALEMDFRDRPRKRDLRPHGGKRSNSLYRWMVALSIAGFLAGTAALVLVAILNVSVPGNRPIGGNSPPPAARLTGAVNCVWSSSPLPPGEVQEVKATAPVVGDELAAGRKLALESGLAEIAFQGGARAVLEGPAMLEIRSHGSAILNRGKIAVTVETPQARGFQIDTPGMKYTDLGTEFGVQVAQSGEQEVHVFRGCVQAEHDKDTEGGRRGDAGNSPAPPLPVSPSPPLVLSAHEAIRVAAPDARGKPAKPIERIGADEKRFVRTEQMVQIVARIDRWKQYRDELCKRAGLVAYYDFQPDESDRTVLRNRAATGAQFDGKLVGGAQWCEGRFRGKQALAFEKPGSGVRVEIPVDCQQITIAAWVRLQPVQQPHPRAILNSDDWGKRAGAVHCQFDGSLEKIHLDLSEGDTGTNIAESVYKFDKKSLFDRWCLFAVTYDATAGRAVTYFNDLAVGDAGCTKAVAAQIGRAMIGRFMSSNRNEGSPERTLGGRIDELMIFDRTLTAEEIKDLYKG